MGLQKSPPNPKAASPPASSRKVTPQKPVFSRSFGVYFPRSSAQVQPSPPDVAHLLRLIEELRNREARLKTELLEFKLLKESVAVVPVLENDISAKNAELEKAIMKIQCLESENELLRTELSEAKVKFEEEIRESDEKVKALEAEIVKLKKTLSDKESEELSSSQRFQGLMEFSTKSNLIRNLKKGVKCKDSVSASHETQNHKSEPVDVKRDEVEIERPSQSRCNLEELVDSTHSNLRSRAPKVPKPPPKRSSSSNSISLSTSSSISDQSISAAAAPPPPPASVKPAAPLPPPPPPPKGMRMGPANKVKRVPEVVEFYHSLMRRDSRRESTSGNPDVLPATANARDMIGEIENRSTHLLAVSFDFRLVCSGFHYNYKIATVAVYCL